MSGPEQKQDRKRDKVEDFLKTNWTKGELALKHAAGLGNQPSVIPVGEPHLHEPHRPVEVGWHPVGGAAGKWFAEDTSLGKLITQRIHKYPDPTQHWAVLVGDYAHQLWMDEKFDVIYFNQKINREEWKTFSVGETSFNDDAIRRTGESVIQTIRDRQPAYNLINNNCQTYALQLLDAIKVAKHKQFGTTLAVYQRLVGPGNIMDLFAPGQADAPPPPPPEDDSVSVAQQVMHENTTQLDTHEEMKKHKDWKWRRKDAGHGEHEQPEEAEEAEVQEEQEEQEGKADRKKGIFSRFSRK